MVGPYTSTRGLNHTPDGLLVCAARIAEGKKEDSYAALDKTSQALKLPFKMALDQLSTFVEKVDQSIDYGFKS